jgi:hypothetical protein
MKNKALLSRLFLTALVCLIWFFVFFEYARSCEKRDTASLVEVKNGGEKKSPPIDWHFMKDPFWGEAKTASTAAVGFKNQEPGIRLKGIVDSKALVESLENPGVAHMLGEGETIGNVQIKEVAKDHIKAEREKVLYLVFMDHWEFDKPEK